jgi:hypothetical protein
VDRDRGVRAGLVADLGALVDARTHPVIVGSGQHDLRSGLAQQLLELQGDAQVVGGFGVARGGLGPDRVARLGLAIADRYLLIDLLGVRAVLAVVPWVDRDDHAGEPGIRTGDAIRGRVAS